MTEKHQNHTDIIKRLKRSHGHLSKTIEMLENHRSCPDVAQQLMAVEKAVRAAKLQLIYDHVDHCIVEAFKNPADNQAAIKEFKQLSRYF